MSEIRTDQPADDTEGHHYKRHGIEDEPTTQTDDTEGHHYKRHGLEDDASDDDVEGHKFKRP